MTLFAQTVRLEQTLLALPLAYVALLLAEGGLPTASHLLWITVAMTGARTFGMATNRLIDADIDRRNPRTAGRPMPAGLLSHSDMLPFMAAAIAVFLIGVWQLSPWARLLWPVVLITMFAYPYFKRFTWLCHFGVAAVYVMVPAGVWIAVTNSLPIGAILLGFAAGSWATGFDIIYQSQDHRYDRANGLHSIPARFGPAAALRVARGFHGLATLLLACAGVLLEVGILYYLGVSVFLALAVYEHTLVSARDLSRANVASFNMNVFIGVTFLAFVAADVLTA